MKMNCMFGMEVIMDIGVIGGGATGLLVSYYLNMSHKVTLYVRRHEQKKSIKTNGIKQVESTERQNITVNQINNLQTHELLIICVKSVDVVSVLNIIKEKDNRSPVLFLQNGMGHVPFFSTMTNDVFVGTIEHGVVRNNDYTFHHLGIGQIKVAAISKQKKIRNLQEELTSNLFPVTVVTDWEQLLKEKLIINAVINPLTALFDIENKGILENSYITKLAKMLCNEVANTLMLDEKKSWQQVKMIATKTGDNTSSMRSDVLRKTETEIEAILGYVLSQSKSDLPLVDFLYKSIKALEERNHIL